MGKFKDFLNEATFGDEPKYLIVVLNAIKNGEDLFLGASGKEKIRFKYTKELKKIHDLASKNLRDAMLMLKKGKYYDDIFTDGEKSYKWNQIYKGQFSGASRKNSTASSNVNEIFSLYFLNHVFKDVEKTINEIATTKGYVPDLYAGNGKKISYKDLYELVLQDDTYKKDIMIGYHNANAIKRDLTKQYKKLYWTYREKPNGIDKGHPADIVIEFDDGTMIGYSNKAIDKGEDLTPKINTNINSFFEQVGHGASDIKKMIDDSWEFALNNSNQIIRDIITFDIKKEPYTEAGSKNKFFELSDVFDKKGLNFRGEDFYYPFRNELINKFSKFLQDEKNCIAFLNGIGERTFGVDVGAPYKLLIGTPSGSKIKNVSSDETLKSILNTKTVKNIKTEYNNVGQTFTLYGTSNGFDFRTNITLRTRTKGGWSGKSLYITTPGIKY